jgi:enamine deaminase RidA (YjgF/YER057c/UK114 family)
MSGAIERKLAELGETLPTPPAAVGYYVPVLRTGSLVMTSGQLPSIGKELPFKGKVGRDLTTEEGHSAARIACLNALAQIRACVGSLDEIRRVVRLEGFVQSADGFSEQPQVLNGASELLVQLFGEAGKHTRFAVGVNQLPLNAAVEVALWVEV